MPTSTRGRRFCISIGLLAAAWVVYDVLCRLLADRELLLAACILGLVTATSYGVAQLYSPSAAYLQVGAMLGTIMVANVLVVIMPGHRELVQAKKAGREPDPKPGIVGKQRSVHNNYLTLPVLFSMLAGHFTFTYGARPRLGRAGRADGGRRCDPPLLQPAPRGPNALVDPRRLRGRDRCDCGLAAPARTRRPLNRAPLRSPFARVQQVVAARCQPCHSQHPDLPGLHRAAARGRARHAGGDPRPGVPRSSSSPSPRP